MRVLCLIPHPYEGASGRCRIFQYLPSLERAGMTATVRPFLSPAMFRLVYLPGHLPSKMAMAAVALTRRLTDLVRCAHADVVLIHREAVPLGTAFWERAIVGLGRPVVFDFDDAVYLDHTSEANAWTRAFRRGAKTATIIRLSRHVIAGNRVLADYAQRFNPRVTVIPTPVDAERFTCRAGALSDPSRLIIGWMGSPTTAGYLAPMQPVFEALTQRYPQLRIRIIGAQRVPLRLQNLELVPWRLEDEAAQLQTFDIGVMPMPDDDWARGKCGYKALLYMSAGIPVVAAPVGVNCDIVQDGVNGLLATDAASWTAALARLIEDAALRRQMGEAGRTALETRYSVAVNAPRFIHVLRLAAGQAMASDPPSAWPVSAAEGVHAH